MQQMRRMNLFGLDDQGRMVWQSAVGIGDAELMRERMDWGDLDGDGTGEWVAAIADGTIRVYAKDGKELGRQARGDYVTALCVQGPTRSGQPARLWLAVGRRVLGLEWQTW
jgi:sugar lactone lactonase YvrE